MLTYLLRLFLKTYSGESILKTFSQQEKLPNFYSLLVNLHYLFYQRMRRGGGVCAKACCVLALTKVSCWEERSFKYQALGRLHGSVASARNL